MTKRKSNDPRLAEGEKSPHQLVAEAVTTGELTTQTEEPTNG